MDHRTLHNIQWDERIKEGVEYLDSFWALILLYEAHNQLVDELDRSRLAQEMNNFHRRCTDNDKPGKRHMLPFIWHPPFGYGNDGDKRAPMQLPVKVGTPQYELVMNRYKARMAELKRRTPGYGTRI